MSTKDCGRGSIGIIGAGIVGVSVALTLQREGWDVTIIDGLPPGSGASFGNQCMISPDLCVPMSIPGMLRKVPRWLSDPLGPLAIKPSYFPRVAPWLLEWSRAGRFDRVLARSDAMRSLHNGAFDAYRELLGAREFSKHIRTEGQVCYWEGKEPPEEQPVQDVLWERHGVVAEDLPLEDLYHYVPSLTRDVSKAIILPKNGHTTNPQRLVLKIAQLFEEAGGTIKQENVLKIIPESEGYRLVTGIANHRFSQVVVAAGAWSQRLLAPLGYRLPLETERGYHVTIEHPNVELPTVPILCLNRPAGISPLDGSIRATGSIEFAGLDAPMNEKRADVQIRRTEQMLPGLKIKDYSIWMGHRPSFPDNLPVIDRAPNHRGLFFAFGHSHSGMTSAPATGRHIAALIGGRESHINLAPFSASRF
ncbi:FAD-binding oxidoreductase [Paraburkholderia phymatum]|uniref:NAD(P)/FAD-dependent oxidoreductase n=1 Tax=Paraburkholderia phymatum TaxID=148447 RepID=UPI003170E794